MERWVGRVAFVTGASVGIGASICRKLVSHGMIVIGCAREVQKIQDIAVEQQIKSQPGQLHPIKCDLSKETEISAMFEEIRKKHGRIDVCINNAGFSADSSLLSGKTSDWRKMLEVNILALCICTRESLKLMQENKIDDGQIIQMGSVVGHKIPNSQKNTPAPGFGIYYGSKFMVRGLTESLMQELKIIDSKIRVATISPGAVETEFFSRATNPDIARAFYGSMKCLTPEDVADAVVYILKNPPHVNVDDIILQPVDFRV